MKRLLALPGRFILNTLGLKFLIRDFIDCFGHLLLNESQTGNAALNLWQSIWQDCKELEQRANTQEVVIAILQRDLQDLRLKVEKLESVELTDESCTVDSKSSREYYYE